MQGCLSHGEDAGLYTKANGRLDKINGNIILLH